MASLARRAASLSRLSISNPKTPIQAPNLIHRRNLAGAADHHGPPKVNCWTDPMSPSKWKEEHFVIVSLSGWGLLLYGGYKLFTGGKGKKEEKLVAAPVRFGAYSQHSFPDNNMCPDFSDKVLFVFFWLVSHYCLETNEYWKMIISRTICYN